MTPRRSSGVLKSRIYSGKPKGVPAVSDGELIVTLFLVGLMILAVWMIVDLGN